MIRQFLHYRRIGLRRAWHLARMDILARTVIKVAIVLIVLASIYQANVNTIQMRLDQQAVMLHDRHVNMSLENKALKKIVASCVGPKEGSIWIGDVMYMCGIANTGIKK